jgi:putative Mn2+ efflux pump MntP
LAIRKKEAKKATLRRKKEEVEVVEKNKRAKVKAKKVLDKSATKVISAASPSLQPCKHNATLTGSSFSTLQHGTSLLARVSIGASIARVSIGAYLGRSFQQVFRHP